MPILRTGEDVSEWRGRKYGTEILDIFGYHSELTSLSYAQQEEVLRLRKLYGVDDPRSIEAFEQYKTIRNQIARARTQGMWAEDEFKTYSENPTQSNYNVFIKSAEKTQTVSPLVAAPPKHPELEEERGKLFGALLFLESVSGTTIYNLRKKRGFGAIDWIEQTEADEALKEISPAQALGITTRETKISTPRGIIGFLVDVGLDPLTYMTPVGTVASIGGKALKISRYGRMATTGEEGIKVLERQTRWIREAYPGVSAKEAREAAESLVYGLAKRKPSILAARKYQEPSFSIFGQPLFYYSDIKKPLSKAWEVLPYYKQRQAAYKGAAFEVRKTFEPFYEVGQAAGDFGKDIFKQMIRKTEYERDVWGKRASDLYKKGPRWWKRSETADVHEQTLEWIQRGVEPTDPRVYAMADDLVKGQREAAEAEIAAGLLDPTALREGYVFRVYDPKFRKEVLEKEFGHRQGEDITVYVRQLESRYPRTFMPESSHREINEWAMEKYGIKALVTDPAAIMQMRGIESSRAIATAELHRRVGEELGVHPEKVFPLAGRRYQKYTPAEIDKILEERYGKRLLQQYKRLGVAPSAEMGDIGTIFKKMERDQGVLRAQTLVSPLPESAMVGQKKLILRPYQLTTGEKRVSYVDEGIVKELDRTVEQSHIMLDSIERYMRWGYTVPWIAFHARNVQGIAWQNMYYRVGPEDYDVNWQILHGDPKKMFDVPIYGKMEAGEIKQMFEEAGIYGQTGYIQEPMRFKDMPMGPMPEIENLGRGALATRLLFSGKGIEEAAHTVRLVHFEYGMAGLTRREQKYARRAFLFYTWPKKNVQLTARMLGQQPGTMATAIKAQQYVVTPEEYEQLPAWAKEMYVLSYNGQFYVIDIPFVQGVMTAAGEGYAFSHTPLLKFYIGAVWGRDPSTGRPLGLEDMPMWAAEAGIGRFVSFDRELKRVGQGDITWEQMALHQTGGVYVGELGDMPLKEAYRAAQWVEWKVTEEEKIYAFEASGRSAAHYETLWKPDGSLRGKEPKKAFLLGRWGFATEAKEEIPAGIVIGYTHKQWEIIAGHKLSDEQKTDVKNVYEQVGAQEAALLRVQMASEYHVARAMMSGREPIPPQEITEAYNNLVARVGPEAAKKWHYKAYYSEKGKLLDVLGFTDVAWSDIQGFELSEAQKQWLFRETLTPAEGVYNEWIEQANQIESVVSLTAMLFPRPKIPMHQLSEREKVAMVKMWKAESDARILQETEWRKEYAELRADPLGKSISRKGISAIVMEAEAGVAIAERQSRMSDLETLIGTGVDR